MSGCPRCFHILGSTSISHFILKLMCLHLLGYSIIKRSSTSHRSGAHATSKHHITPKPTRGSHPPKPNTAMHSDPILANAQEWANDLQRYDQLRPCEAVCLDFCQRWNALQGKPDKGGWDAMCFTAYRFLLRSRNNTHPGARAMMDLVCKGGCPVVIRVCSDELRWYARDAAAYPGLDEWHELPSIFFVLEKTLAASSPNDFDPARAVLVREIQQAKAQFLQEPTVCQPDEEPAASFARQLGHKARLEEALATAQQACEAAQSKTNNLTKHLTKLSLNHTLAKAQLRAALSHEQSALRTAHAHKTEISRLNAEIHNLIHHTRHLQQNVDEAAHTELTLHNRLKTADYNAFKAQRAAAARLADSELCNVELNRALDAARDARDAAEGKAGALERLHANLHEAYGGVQRAREVAEAEAARVRSRNEGMEASRLAVLGEIGFTLEGDEERGGGKFVVPEDGREDVDELDQSYGMGNASGLVEGEHPFEFPAATGAVAKARIARQMERRSRDAGGRKGAHGRSKLSISSGVEDDDDVGAAA